MKKRTETLRKRNIIKRCVTFILALVLVAGLMPDSLAGALHLTQTTQAAMTLSNPRIVIDSSMKAGQKVTWDCVWFGSYPQTEIVDQASTCGTYGEDFGTPGDYQVNSSLYNTLKKATGWNSKGDITISGEKYRRIKKGEAYYTDKDFGFYKWDSADKYHYFRYDPIKWRVLNVSDGIAFLLADKVLDDKRYNENEEKKENWECCSIRSWLNNYGISMHTSYIDYTDNGFLKTAFNSSEQDAMIDTFLVNENNIEYKTSGGNNTKDKIFMLSEADTYTTKATGYGFVVGGETDDEARRAKSSTYAKAMGVWSDYEEGAGYDGNCWWWLRTPGYTDDYAMICSRLGYVANDGWSMSEAGNGVRPAMNLELKYSNLWSYAGTVCSDGTQKIPVSKITLSGISHKIAAGKKIKLTATVSPSDATNKAVTWKSPNTKVATVTSTGTVTVKAKTGGKSVTIMATAKDGSKVEGVWKITSMKGVVKKITLSGKNSVKKGSKITLKAKITASKGANRTLKWTSSNTKYATVSSKGVVKGLVKGKTVKITASATDGSGKKATKKIKIK